ncbi:MAG: LytTR family DNA-binding domain-containing protein [Saprospiraceae bacterium]|nr:LytTR family DNA-binding domain-containing protein [Saprospiraceae bacterium]
MIRTLIINKHIDSNPLLLEIIQEYAPSIEVVSLARDNSQALDQIELHKPDLIFLDIDMDGYTTFELLESIKSPTFKIIFTAKNEKFALKAFKYGAIDYILHPFDPQDILSAIDRVKKTQFNEVIYNRLDYLIRQNHIGQNHKITIPTAEGINILSISDIQRIEADRSYCFIYLAEGDRILVSKPLKEIESMLPDSIFFRVHSAYLINMNYVKRYKKEDGGYVILNDGSHIPIARRRKKEFFERLSQ